jgi:hypothetical protein
MAKTKVFISFDFDNDKILKDYMVGQAKLPDSPFEISDWSMKEAAPERNWVVKARQRIQRCDVVMVILGPNTWRASGVLKEVGIAIQEGIRRIQVIGYKDGDYTPIVGAGQLLKWTWGNLEKWLS